MLRRIGALLRKERWHHGLVLLGLVVLLGGVLLFLLLGAAIAPRTITMLEAHASFVRYFLPIVALAVSHRLVVREYCAHTQRFLEGLPLRRSEMVVTKYVLGLAAVSAFAVLSLALSLLVAILKEPLDPPWLAIVLLRTMLFAFALHSVLFAMALLGRWRMPSYLGAAFLMLFTSSSTSFELGRFGPFALVGETFVYERFHLAPEPALVTAAIGVAALVLALVLALAREGAIVERFAAPMTQREKVAVGVVLALSMIAGELHEGEKDAFRFSQIELVEREDARLVVLHLDRAHRPAAELFAHALAEDLATLRDELGLELPRTHVALREALEPGGFEAVPLEDPGAVLVRASFADPSVDLAPARAGILAAVIDRATDGRAAVEPYAWVRDAVAGRGPRRETLDADASHARLALWLARERAPSVAMLERRRLVEERYGPDAARAWSVAAGLAMERRLGRAPWLAFARTVLREPPWAPYAVFEARRDPMRARLGRAIPIEELEAAWREELAAYRTLHGEALREVPRAEASVDVERDADALLALRWRVRFDRPPEPGSTCTLLHLAIGAFDRPLAESELAREERECAELAPEGEVLLGRYGPGERVFLAVEVSSTVLGAPVRVHAERRELR